MEPEGVLELLETDTPPFGKTYLTWKLVDIFDLLITSPPLTTPRKIR
jgi:hypothetical protein